MITIGFDYDTFSYFNDFCLCIIILTSSSLLVHVIFENRDLNSLRKVSK